MIRNRLALWLLDRVPAFLRTRRPLRRFYWQDGDIERARAEAEKIAAELGL